MANVWRNGRWEDDATGNVLVGGAPGANGTWEGGTWQNQQGASYLNGQWMTPFQADSNVFNRQQASLNAQRQTNAAQEATLPFQQGVINAQRGVLPYTQATLNAQGGVLQARQGLLGPQQGTINAQGGIIQAQGAQNQGARIFTIQQQEEVKRQKGEYQNQLLAENNPQDQAAVATAKRYRAATDARNRTLGITPAQEIDVPLGFNNPLPPGVRAKLTTQGEDVQRANAESQKLRGFDMDSARLAVQLLSSDVDQARLVAAQAGMTLDQARLAVDAAENAAGFAGLREKQAGVGVDYAKLDEAQAGLGVTRAKYGEDNARLDVTQSELERSLTNRAPFEGAERYTDPTTGQQSWMTPAQKDRLEYDYQTSLGYERIPSQYELNRSREVFKTGTEGQGSPLQGWNDTELANYFYRGEGLVGGSRAFGGSHEQQIYAELMRQWIVDMKHPGDAAGAARFATSKIAYWRALLEGRNSTKPAPPSTGTDPTIGP